MVYQQKRFSLLEPQNDREDKQRQVSASFNIRLTQTNKKASEI